MTQNLDFAFDEFLKENATEAVNAITSFRKKLGKAPFKYGRVTIPSFYKPFVLTNKQQHLVKRVTTAIDKVINTTLRYYFEEPAVSRYFDLPEGMKELVEIDPGYSGSIVFSRFDGVLEGESLKLVAFNCDSPAGAAYAETLEGVFNEEKLYQDFAAEHAIEKYNRIQQTLETLLEIYEEFGGYETPNILIMDWRHARTNSEFEVIQSYFQEKGYKTIIADPRELQYRGGKLYHKDTAIHLIYRRALTEEILNRIDEVQDFLRAYKEKAVCVVNPLRSCLASNKAILSILTNPEFDHFFTETENEIKREHLPWTRRIDDAEDFFGHRKIYLIDFLKDEKDSLVLKPAKSDGGKLVAIGSDTAEDDWNQVIDRAIKSHWMIQEFVSVPALTVPEVVGGKLDFKYKKFNFSNLSFGGKYGGGFIRMSDQNVIRVADQGGLLPVFWSDQPAERFAT